MQAFRIAKKAPGWFNLGKTLLQTLFFWSIFLFLIPALISHAERAWGWPVLVLAYQKPVAVFGFVMAGSLGIWSGVTMALRGKGTPLPLDTARRLVISGPYRYVRNPMAIAGLAQGAFVGLWAGSFGVLIYVAIGAGLWNQIARPKEEEDLQLRFGADYERYRRHVRCWIPGRPTQTIP